MKTKRSFFKWFDGANAEVTLPGLLLAGVLIASAGWFVVGPVSQPVHAQRAAVLSQRLLTAQSALNTAQAVTGSVTQVRELRAYATFGAGTSAGVVTIEGAPVSDYSGTWASLGTLTWSAASKVETLRIEGAHLAVRARISTAIVGGTVTVDIVGN